MSSIFTDGLEWLQNKVKKIEGYRGIMGPITEIDSMNASDPDFLNKTTYNNNLAQGIATYNTKYNALTSATNDYLGMTSLYGENKNYNIFVNTPMEYSSITASVYTGGGCIANNPSSTSQYSALTAAGLTDTSSKGFDEAYPNNFPNTLGGTVRAMNACKLWAADSQVPSSSSTNPDNTWFAITKYITDPVTKLQKFKCFTGNALQTTPNPYMVEKVAYTIASTSDATRGGLFMDGTVGVYNNNANTTAANINNPYKISTPFLAPFDKFTKCDKFFGGAVNTNSISASLGVNCSNTNGTPVNIRYVFVNTNRKQSSSQDNGWIQISQLAVFAYVNGTGRNVSSRVNNNKAVAHSGNGPGYTNQTDSAYSGTNINTPIDGNVASRDWPYIYHSVTKSTNEWWSVDLGQEYPVYEITYYNRKDCCWYRAVDMTIQFKDGAGSLVTVKDSNGNATQTLTIPSTALVQKFNIAKP